MDIDLKFVPLTSVIKQIRRPSWKHKVLRAKVEELLAQEGNSDALELYVPDKHEWDYWLNVARSIVYKYNGELKAGLLSVRVNREDRVLYIYKNFKIGYDKYLR